MGPGRGTWLPEAWKRAEDALDGLSGNFFGRYDLTTYEHGAIVGYLSAVPTFTLRSKKFKCNMPKIPFVSAGKRPENSQKHVDMGEILVQVPCVG